MVSVVLNDKVLPLMVGLGMGVIRILTGRGTEYCGKPETHDYQLYLTINDIEHTKTKVRHPQTNGICERFHKTILDEFYKVAFRKKTYQSLEGLQNDLETPGLSFTIMNVPTRAKCAAEERRCKPCSTESNSGTIKSRP